MALYQPTNIIPSSYTKGTVDAVNDNMEISWQVNGNSAMTAFQIDFYLNDANSTYVTSTGRLTDNCPFYGTDRFGKPQFFTWNANDAWDNFNSGFTNGNEYKYKITQWYSSGSDEYTIISETSLIQNTLYYFPIIGQGEIEFYVVFTQKAGTLPAPTILYNKKLKQAYYVRSDNLVAFDSSESSSPLGEKIGVATNWNSVEPNAFSVFISRDKPTLTLFRSNDSYSNKIDLPSGSNIATSIGYFRADYEQLQGNAIRWIRWQVATASKNNDNTYNLGEIIADTGDIYTPTLNYEFNGFFNGQQYAIRCFGESESGQDCDSGWVYFNIKIENQGEYLGDLTVQCLNKENATLLKWDGIETILPTTTGNYSLSNGALTLSSNSNISWSKIKENKVVPFNNPWTAVWVGNISFNYVRQELEISEWATGQKEFNGELYWFYESSIEGEGINPNKILDIEVFPNDKSVIYQIDLKQNPPTVTLLSKQIDRFRARIIVYEGEPLTPKGELFCAFANNVKIISMSQSSNAESNYLTVLFDDKEVNIQLRSLADKFICVFGVLGVNIYFYKNGKLIYDSFTPVTYFQNAISSVSVYGGEVGAVVHSISIYQGDEKNILKLYQDPDFEPTWNDQNYDLYMTANFNNGIQGGTGTSTGYAFRVYRQEIGKNILTPIATVLPTITSVKDYGIVSRKAYKYSLYAYDNNGAFMSAVENEKVVATCFKNYSLLVCDYDEENDEYHVRKQYLFALNLSTGSVGNNNSPTLNANFTRYPTRMPSTQNYASGTLQGLIGAIYTVPALIEQIGNYKWTAKPSTMDYFDSVDLEQELYDLSTAPYQLFLRDMKGRLRMVATNGAITMTTNIKQKQQSISISFPWVEIGDASDVTIIQTPDDYGWNNDNQVLDVSLDVDVETGELSATYPYPYNGTKFYLTGVNKETLTAKTPLGVTPAQFDLSETATQPDDGELNATVKVNSEDN